MADGALPRKTPCATCPYRKNVPSGIWHEEEYAKLPAYDRETFDQPVQAFSCHQQDGSICAGWLAYGEPYDLLAVRIGVATGALDPSCGSYTTTVPLHESGAAAAEHGLRDLIDPSPAARAAIAKLDR